MRPICVALCWLPVLFAAVLAGCMSEPQVEFGSMCIQRLGTEATDYVATVHIYNPNEQTLRVQEITWALCAGQQLIVERAECKDVELPGQKTSPVNIYVQVPVAALGEAGLAEQRRFNYDFTGQVRLIGPLGGATLPFGSSGVMPVIHPLEVKLVRVERIGVTESKVGLMLTAEVVNHNDVALAPAGLKGDLLINNRRLIVLDTTIEQSVCVPANGSAPLRMPMWVSSPELGIRSLDALVATEGTRFRLVGLITFRVPGSGDVTDVLADPTTQPDQ